MSCIKDLTISTPMLKKSSLTLLLLLILPLTAQAEFCKQGRLPNLADTMKRVDMLDPDFSWCRSHVNMAFLIWAGIGCSRDLNALEDKTDKLDALGLNPPHDPHSASDVIHVLAVDMAYAGESLENTQQAALKACHQLEEREKRGEVIHW